MKTVTQAKAAFNQQFSPYIEAIQQEFDRNNISFFFKRQLGVCSGLKGLVRARGFLSDISKDEVTTITGMLVPQVYPSQKGHGTQLTA